MTTPQSTSKSNAHTFVNAKLVQTRLVSQQIDSVPMQRTVEPKPIQFKAETTAEFTVALDDPNTPQALLIEVQYKVVLKLAESDQEVASYKGKHAGEFRVIDYAGFQEWINVPHMALVPHFATMHHTALKHAQHCLLDMGLGAIVLPVLSDSDLAPLTPANQIAQ